MLACRLFTHLVATVHLRVGAMGGEVCGDFLEQEGGLLVLFVRLPAELVHLCPQGAAWGRFQNSSIIPAYYQAISAGRASDAVAQ